MFKNCLEKLDLFYTSLDGRLSKHFGMMSFCKPDKMLLRSIIVAKGTISSTKIRPSENTSTFSLYGLPSSCKQNTISVYKS